MRRPPQSFLPLSPLSAGILLAVAGGARHGYAIIQEIERQEDGRKAPGAGSLYAALRRMSDEGLLVEREEAASDAGPRRRCYDLTALGREVLRLEMQRMAELLRTAAARDLIGARDLPLGPEEGR